MTDILPASQVAELINGLVKALRAYHMYLPNNPIYQRASDNLRTAFQPIWAVLDELTLTVAETDFVWENEVVYHQLSKADSIAWGLFKDGMRSLTIGRGGAARLGAGLVVGAGGIRAGLFRPGAIAQELGELILDELELLLPQ